MSLTVSDFTTRSLGVDPFDAGYTAAGLAICAALVVLLVVRELIGVHALPRKTESPAILDAAVWPLVVSFLVVAGARLLTFLG
jgi:hypothetical protein